LSAALSSRRQSRDLSPETLKLTATLLSINPDYATLWNYRREIVEAAKGGGQEGEGGWNKDDAWKIENEVRARGG